MGCEDISFSGGGLRSRPTKIRMTSVCGVEPLEDFFSLRELQDGYIWPHMCRCPMGCSRLMDLNPGPTQTTVRAVRAILEKVARRAYPNHFWSIL